MLINAQKIEAFEYTGSPQTIALMAKAARDSQYEFAVRQYAEHACGQVASKDYASEYMAIFFATLRDTRYMRDPATVELVKAPVRVAEQILAGGRPSLDCDDAATFLAALCLAVGARPQFVTVAFSDMSHNGERQYSHVFTRVQDSRTGRWIVLDPVAAERTDDMLGRVQFAKIWPIV